MPLPLVVLIPAVLAGVGGVGAGTHGALRMKSAKELMVDTAALHERNLMRFKLQSDATSREMDALGQLEMSILRSFNEFSKLFERIHSKPEFRGQCSEGVTLPVFDPSEIKEVSIGANVLLNILSGGALGVAGGFAAAGATTAAVMALGTASTGTAIASLSGAAAINATLASLGGGALAAGGGGIALGTTVLGTATFGTGLLIGGVIFSFTGASLSNKVDEAWFQVKQEEVSVTQICNYLQELYEVGRRYYGTLSKVNKLYKSHLHELRYIVNALEKIDYHCFSDEEKLKLQNTVLLVGVLHEMCKVNLVIHSEHNEDINQVNHTEVDKSLNSTEVMVRNLQTTLLTREKSTDNERERRYDERLKQLVAEGNAKINKHMTIL
ncbi:hypothetical protein [Paenibacillus sp. MER 99-2]|uniref:hypothetical protein n=1 Tax=Paenibacillus sp. MER 99-2 TaxID=2939572 RepID=UPI002040178E|nr:hypothetical protein [Paenibacillus sp. MER 99-2]MCM3174397.1 hypothetical protein [Paenibacillus sp. MER 99-2]